MSPFTYKGLNLYFFKQCETLNLHLYLNNLLLKFESIHHAPPQVEILSSTYTCTVVDIFTTSWTLQRDTLSDHYHVRKTFDTWMSFGLTYPYKIGL